MVVKSSRKEGRQNKSKPGGLLVYWALICAGLIVYARIVYTQHDSDVSIAVASGNTKVKTSTKSTIIENVRHAKAHAEAEAVHVRKSFVIEAQLAAKAAEIEGLRAEKEKLKLQLGSSASTTATAAVAPPPSPALKLKPWNKDGCSALWYWKEYSIRPNTTANTKAHRGTHGSGKYDLAFDLRGQNGTCQEHWPSVNSFAEAAPRFVAVLTHYFIERRKPLTNIPCMYINRKKDVARKIRMEEAFARFSTRVTRVAAVTPDSALFNNSVTAALHLTGYGKEVTPASASVFSITMSHVLAIHTAYTKGYHTALFLEDDAVLDLLPFWADSLNQYVRQLPTGWLASQVGHTPYGSDGSLPYAGANRANRFRQGHEWGAFAYLLSRRGIEIIIEKYWDGDHGIVNLDALAADCIDGLQGMRMYA
jgi:hypothetical protein